MNSVQIITILTMLFVGGLVFGGLIFFILKAVKYENLKKNDGEK
jgi:hypothetical protein